MFYKVPNRTHVYNILKYCIYYENRVFADHWLVYQHRGLPTLGSMSLQVYGKGINTGTVALWTVVLQMLVDHLSLDVLT